MVGYDNTTTFIAQLFNVGIIRKKAFSIYFGKQDSSESKISFGSYSDMNLTEATFLDVKKNLENTWMVEIANFCYGEDVCLNLTSRNLKVRISVYFQVA